MKNTALLLTLTLLLLSCDKDKGVLRQDAQVTITGTNSFSKAPAQSGTGILGTDITDSLVFITKYTEAFNFMSLDGSVEWGSSSFAGTEENYLKRRDLTNNKLLFEGGHVIQSDETLGPFILDCKDACFYVQVDRSRQNAIFPVDVIMNPEWDPGRVDTVAYIPNAVLNKARTEITAAFEREDYAECYRLFDRAFVFVPTTGAKWRAMKAAGIE